MSRKFCDYTNSSCLPGIPTNKTSYIEFYNYHNNMYTMVACDKNSHFFVLFSVLFLN